MSARFTTRPDVRGRFGVVTSTHWIGTAVGMGALERGGNAFDAAVATGFALQVVEPHLNGPGGEVAILAHRAGDEAPSVVCGQGVAPRAASVAAFRERGLSMVPGTGLLAAVVPGAFDAWMRLLRDHGTMTLRDVLEPAIGYASDGFPIGSRAAGSIHAIAAHFRDAWPSSAAVWLPGGRAPLGNEWFRTPAIGACYRRLLAEAEALGTDRVAQIEAARRAFREGFVADAIDRHCRHEFESTDGRRDAGLLTGDDLAGWRASVEPSVSLDYRGHRIHKTGPWGQGPAMLQALALLRDVDLDAMDPLGADFVHAVTEATKLALADRDVFYGDPAFVDVPLATLLSDAHARARRGLIGDTASNGPRPSELPGADARLAALLALAGSEAPTALGGGEPTFADVPEIEGDTVHLDVADRFGNVVSATPSGGWLQSSPVVPELGFALNTRAQMFWLDERLPSALAPGRRPRTTLTPTIVTRDGEPRFALGSPGGDQQDPWSLTFLLRQLHHGGSLQANIDAPMFHTEGRFASFYPRALGEALVIEDRFDEKTLAALRARGHALAVRDGWSVGRLCAVARGRDGTLRAGATPRFMQAHATGR